ncbi:biopolymer transporter ExbD [Pseudohongiella nitratireducens]|jgi:biopolymer transport protein ExbD|uniref:Biopolymer transporter ExbD n=1 Tax=Pseudohongiella nitratireducens TaxID=1768907 RepID=A0A917GMT8_9GAMM|nr:biopolymer transporter ExbD [Pseudohongiella nitratireducens]MDF1622969.1 biopolymer transporter ExbD [Pseudohongiella nitratireducens]GGG52071.1 biopolymer transporter ExbD [Pseudohongiella nitratireducens]|tara:strand:- start:1706 stop:2122 length:417 start_codon:yes stop_codon:yes gene_type:complete
MKKLAGQRKDEETNVDLTPMLDVVFILLIFFVVTATFLSEQAIDAASNDSNNETPPETDDEQKNILIELSQNNEITFNGEPRPVIQSQIRANIDRLKAENPAASVIIRPNPRSSVETMVMVMDSARQAGIYDISVVEP